jgi:hypothetical protein
MGTVFYLSLVQSVVVRFGRHQVTHSLSAACVRSVDYFVPKIIHKHYTVIR